MQTRKLPLLDFQGDKQNQVVPVQQLAEDVEISTAFYLCYNQKKKAGYRSNPPLLLLFSRNRGHFVFFEILGMLVTVLVFPNYQ